MSHTVRPQVRPHDTALRPWQVRRPLTTAVLGTAAGLALLVSAPASAVAAPAAPASPSATGEPGDAEKSIVYVGIEWTGYVEYPTADGGWAWSDPIDVQSGCTGWFASEEGHIVTAGHCLDPAEIEGAVLSEFLAENDAADMEDSAQSWRVEGYEEGAPPDRTDVWVVQPSAVEGAVIDDPLTVQVLDFLTLEDGDLALLKANGLQEPTAPLGIATASPEIGDPLTAIGYPGSVMSVSDVTRLRASFKSGTVSSVQVSDNGVAGTEINAEVSAGMSGGPTIDGNGDVLGVNSFGIVGEEQSFNFITDGAALRSFLERQGVEPVLGGGDVGSAPGGDTRPVDVDTASSAAGSTPPAWVFGAGGGVLVLALVAGSLLVTTSRRSGQRTPVAPAFAGPAVPMGTTAAVDATRRIDRPRVPPVAPSAARRSCSHTGNPPGARFCGDCGSRLAR